MSQVTITNSKPQPNPVSISRGGIIEFKSGDDRDYVVDTSDRSLSGDFPLDVPADGNFHRLQIKGGANTGSFAYTIAVRRTDGSVGPAGRARGENPEMIVD